MKATLVSVVLAVRNEEQFIARTLEAVLRQDYPREAMEIIVVDGASEDRTVDVIQSLDIDRRVRVVANPRHIQAAGLNLGIEQARGDIVVRVDGHTILEPDYVSQCVAALAETGASNAGGRMEPLGLSRTGQAIAAAGTTPFAVPTAFHVSMTAQYTDTVYMGAWPRTTLLAAGGFDEQLRTNEDYELNYRIRRAGGRVYLSPAIRSTYVCRQTLPALARQYASYGVGKAVMLRKHPASLRVRQLVAPAFVAALAGGLVLWPFIPPARVLLLAMLASYAALSLAFSVSAVAQSDGDWRLVWRLPLVYLTIHMCWGSGFWWGMLVGLVESGAQRRRGSADLRPSIAREALGFEEHHGL
jgi:glycosyltransferase involved in cell wall biosynthesis